MAWCECVCVEKRRWQIHSGGAGRPRLAGTQKCTIQSQSRADRAKADRTKGEIYWKCLSRVEQRQQVAMATFEVAQGGETTARVPTAAQEQQRAAPNDAKGLDAQRRRVGTVPRSSARQQSSQGQSRRNESKMGKSLPTGGTSFTGPQGAEIGCRWASKVRTAQETLRDAYQFRVLAPPSLTSKPDAAHTHKGAGAQCGTTEMAPSIIQYCLPPSGVCATSSTGKGMKGSSMVPLVWAGRAEESLPTRRKSVSTVSQRPRARMVLRVE